MIWHENVFCMITSAGAQKAASGSDSGGFVKSREELLSEKNWQGLVEIQLRALRDGWTAERFQKLLISSHFLFDFFTFLIQICFNLTTRSESTLTSSIDQFSPTSIVRYQPFFRFDFPFLLHFFHSLCWLNLVFFLFNNAPFTFGSFVALFMGGKATLAGNIVYIIIRNRFLALLFFLHSLFRSQIDLRCSLLRRRENSLEILLYSFDCA
jgi:hypothetical protein